MKLFTIILFFCFNWCFCQSGLDPKEFATTITAKELKESLYVYASDYFQGRETGKIGQKRAINFLQDFYTTSQIPPAKGTEDYLQKMQLSIKGINVKTENVAALLILLDSSRIDLITSAVLTGKVLFSTTIV